MTPFQVNNDELMKWNSRRQAIEAIEGSEGFKLIWSRMEQEYEACNEELLRCSRWNWFRILKLLLRRDASLALMRYIEGVKREGKKAEEVLLSRDPQWFKQNQRPVFMRSH